MIQGFVLNRIITVHSDTQGDEKDWEGKRCSSGAYAEFVLGHGYQVAHRTECMVTKMQKEFRREAETEKQSSRCIECGTGLKE